MTTAISKDFLLAYSEIQKSHQKKVREFIELFQTQPGASGINYEAVQSAKGRHLYSARTDQAYRVIIFHPPGTLYVLTWVDHHDEAYRWAANRNVLVNPLTGSLQILNTEETGTTAMS